jgi:PTS system sorbose-specific IIB component
MSIVITRIDERLIHGQVAYSWTVEYGIDTLVVVDDEAAQNQIQKMALNLAVPPKKKLSILGTQEAIKFLKDNEKSMERIFVIVKSPKTVYSLIKQGIDIKSINVGGMYFKPGKKQLNKTVYIDEKERQIFLELKELGVEAEIRTSPKDKKIDLYELI